MKKQLNINECVWFIILILFTGYFYKILYTGEITNFVHPKMVNYIFLSIIVLSLLIIYQVNKLTDYQKEKKIKTGYIWFVFIIFVAVVIKPQGLTSHIAYNKAYDTEHVNSHLEGTCDNNKLLLLSKMNTIEINEKNYIEYLSYINSNLNVFENKKIIVEGFIFKDKSCNSDSFILARMMVTCCAADAEIVGYMCKYKEEKFKKIGLSSWDILNDSYWVKVTGTINKSFNKDEEKVNKSIPIISIEKLEKIEQPKIKKYIYQ